MRNHTLSGQAAFQPSHMPDIANALADASGLRIEIDRRRGRGAGLNPDGRFETLQHEVFDDGWQTLGHAGVPHRGPGGKAAQHHHPQ